MKGSHPIQHLDSILQRLLFDEPSRLISHDLSWGILSAEYWCSGAMCVQQNPLGCWQSLAPIEEHTEANPADSSRVKSKRRNTLRVGRFANVSRALNATGANETGSQIMIDCAIVCIYVYSGKKSTYISSTHTCKYIIWIYMNICACTRYSDISVNATINQAPASLPKLGHIQGLWCLNLRHHLPQLQGPQLTSSSLLWGPWCPRGIPSTATGTAGRSRPSLGKEMT